MKKAGKHMLGGSLQIAAIDIFVPKLLSSSSDSYWVGYCYFSFF